ncbi:MAG: D-arabinono-1,4-lactone oxidase [Ktedonobacteraceae bacterium]
MNTRTARAIRPWRNWSGYVKFTPQQIVKPSSLDELQRIVSDSGRNGGHVRVVGTGHSFTPLVQTEDILLSLDNWQGIEEIDVEKGSVKVRGGTKLHALGEALLAYGLAQENLGDINVQSISGAISTGTHGTGISFGTLSTQVEGLTLITADGELLECSSEHNPAIFKAALVSLGMLGVIAYVTLRVVPTKRLHLQGHRESMSDCFKNMERYKQENTYFSFLWAPYTDSVQVKFLNETTEPVSKSVFWNDIKKIVMKNWVYWLISESCRLFPSLSKSVSKLAASSNSNMDEVNYSHRIFSTPRMVRFQEMEYNIPAEHIQAVLREIQACIELYHFKVHIPLECRFVQADDIWLSPAYQRASSYIAVPMYRGMEYKEYFRHIEDIFRRYQGRPHWGKVHTQTAESLSQLYPHWDDFRHIRAHLDPRGVFLNSYLRDLFDAQVPVSADMRP